MNTNPVISTILPILALNLNKFSAYVKKIISLLVKVKVTRGLCSFSSFTTIQIVSSYSSALTSPIVSNLELKFGWERPTGSDRFFAS